MWNYGIKFLFAVAAALCIWFLQVKNENLQAQNEQKDAQISNLQQTLASQESSMQEFLREYEKQEQEILAYEQQKQELENTIRLKKQAVLKNADEKINAWKEQKIPLSILAILQGLSSPKEN